MPVILRLCVPVETAAPSPASIVLNSNPIAKHISALPLSPTPAPAVDPLKDTLREAAPSPKSAARPAAAEGVSAAGKSDSTIPQPTSAHHHGRHGLFHWLKTLGKKTKLKETTATTPPAAAAARGAPETSQSSHLDQSHANPSPLPSPSTTVEHASPSLRRPATTATTAVALKADEHASKPKVPMLPLPPQPPQRSLVWVSVQLTPATTVKMVLQQVQDMVERRMGARLCDGNYFSAFSTSTTPAGSFANAPPPSQSPRDDGRGEKRQRGLGSAPASPVAQVVSPTSRSGTGTAEAAEEWCLCVQDSDGVYHFVGGTRHEQKSAVLRAPFVAEVCLQSHAAFEAGRQRQREEQKAQRAAQRRISGGGSSQHTSFAAPGGAAPLDNSDAASSGGSSDGSDSSSLHTSDDDADDVSEAAAAAGCGGKHRFLLSRHHNHHRPAAKACKHEKKKSGKSGGKSGAADSSRGRQLLLHPSRLTAKKFSKPSASEAKFAFLKGVVVPSSVLKQRNPTLARHRRKPPPYVEVHVPREMRAEPLDPTITVPNTINITTTTAEAPQTPERSAAIAPVVSAPTAESSLSLPVKGPADALPNAVHPCPSNTSMEEDVDVDVPPSAPTRADSSSFTSSSPTLPSCSPLQDGAGGPLHATLRPSGRGGKVSEGAATAAVVKNGASYGDRTSLAEVNGSSQGKESLLATGEEPSGLFVGLATHATALEGLDEADPASLTTTTSEEAWCRSADAVHVKGVAADLLAQLTAAEDAARADLAKAQRDYAAARAAYRVTVPPAPASIHQRLDMERIAADSTSHADAELTALLKRKIELQAAVEDGRAAERQCERLTALVECLEKEQWEREERRALLTVRVNGN
jgi:hypothetical protein